MRMASSAPDLQVAGPRDGAGSFFDRAEQTKQAATGAGRSRHTRQSGSRPPISYHNHLPGLGATIPEEGQERAEGSDQASSGAERLRNLVQPNPAPAIPKIEPLPGLGATIPENSRERAEQNEQATTGASCVHNARQTNSSLQSQRTRTIRSPVSARRSPNRMNSKAVSRSRPDLILTVTKTSQPAQKSP